MPAGRPDILLILLDAARAENLSVYGYGKRTTPQLERWASQLALYDACISTATWTMPSTASLFTGTYTSTHRLVVDGDRLPEQYATLPELLAREGYYTAKLASQVPYVSDFTGLDRGFAAEIEATPPLWRRAMGALSAARKPEAHQEAGLEAIDSGLDLETEAGLDAGGGWKQRLSFWLSGLYDDGAADSFATVRRLWHEHRDRPKFVYMHMMETHGEYRPPLRHRKRFVPERLRGRDFSAINQRPNPHAVGLVEMTDEDFEVLTGLYDGCIAYMDELIGRLLDDLSKQPGFDETLVIVTADHGDCVGRHGILGHQFVCYDELVRIPWIVKWPKSVGLTGHQAQLVQNADLLPTICGLLGLERPPQCEAIDVLREEREHAYSELLKPFGVTAVKQGLHEQAPQYDRAVLAVRSRTHKWITHSNAQPDELYDLRSDPRELKNLLADGGEPPLEAESLQRAVEAWRPRWQAAADEVHGRIFSGDQADISADVEAKLRALGYLD